jgi:hypothetical protein
MPLFEVAIVEIPTKDEAEKGKQEKLVFGPKAIISKDESSDRKLASPAFPSQPHLS